MAGDVLILFGLNRALKTDLRKKFQNINLRNHLQMCSVSSCVKMLCLHSAVAFGSIHVQVKDKI